MFEPLGRIGDSRAIEHIVPILKHPDSFYRKYGVDIIGNISGKEAKAALSNALITERDYEVRKHIKLVLEKIKD